MEVFNNWVDKFMDKGTGPIAKWWEENSLAMAA
jgi:hypothetical protein